MSSTSLSPSSSSAKFALARKDEKRSPAVCSVDVEAAGSTPKENLFSTPFGLWGLFAPFALLMVGFGVIVAQPSKLLSPGCGANLRAGPILPTGVDAISAKETPPPPPPLFLPVLAAAASSPSLGLGRTATAIPNKGGPAAEQSPPSDVPLTPEEVEECRALLAKEAQGKSYNAFLTDRLGRRLGNEKEREKQQVFIRCLGVLLAKNSSSSINSSGSQNSKLKDDSLVQGALESRPVQLALRHATANNPNAKIIKVLITQSTTFGNGSPSLTTHALNLQSRYKVLNASVSTRVKSKSSKSSKPRKT
eukprot:GHVT01073632.1.p1 GENE.GHVT01073632.1~~GHVT01073632.1.p1  ORF type:complete len:306 (+),score=58.55 GHVT01073632.1:99-1016(+)